MFGNLLFKQRKYRTKIIKLKSDTLCTEYLKYLFEKEIDKLTNILYLNREDVPTICINIYK